MKRILVTGATSFLGEHLIKKLSGLGSMEIIAVARVGHTDSEFGSGVRTVFLDLEEYDRLGKLVGTCDCFFHLAWSGTRGLARMDAELQNRNVINSLKGIQSMLEAGCGRIITAGSQAEYGLHAEQITEQSLCVPHTEYGKAKLNFFQRATALCTKAGVSCIEPRFFSLYGPGDSADTMIISILKDMLADRPCKLTQGIQLWDFLHVDDAVNALIALCDAPCADGVYNFGSGDVRPLRDYVEEMAAITQTKSHLQFGAIPYPKTGMVSLWPDISKLKHELHWEPHIAFADGIRSILDNMDCGEKT